MKVILANPRGFCAGVNMAIDTLNSALDLYGAPIYVFHEIVHNRQVVGEFRKRGVHFVESVESVPRGSKIMFSAHGVSPAVRAQTIASGLIPIDVTCPLVAKVHAEARRFAQQGYQIILIGHAGHDEVVGTMGEVPDQITLVENERDVARLPFPSNTRLAYITQTTLSVEDASSTVAALKRRFPQIVGPKTSDICYATQNRQDAVRALADNADLVLVIGSSNSSNSRRLAELAQSRGIESHLIDSASEIRAEWLVGKSSVLITAGASAPESIVQECVNYLKSHHQADIFHAPGRKENVTFGRPVLSTL